MWISWVNWYIKFSRGYTVIYYSFLFIFFNGILTFVGYLISKSSSQKKQHWKYLTNCCGVNGFKSFSQEYLSKSEHNNVTCLNFWNETCWFSTLGFSDECLYLYCYFHNVSADMSSDLLKVFIELGNLQGTSNYVLYWIYSGHLSSRTPIVTVIGSGSLSF